jgi:hypothetical protein
MLRSRFTSSSSASSSKQKVAKKQNNSKRSKETQKKESDKQIPKMKRAVSFKIDQQSARQTSRQSPRPSSRQSARQSPAKKEDPKGIARSPSSRHIGSFIKDLNMTPNRLAIYKSFLKRIRANKIQKFFRQNLLKTYYTHEKRIKYYHYLMKHIGSLNMNTCFIPKQIIQNSRVIFDGYTIHDKIYLDKQIGSVSAFGVIYKTFIKGTFGGAPIAAKIMRALKSNKKEIDINKLISNRLVLNKLSRHFLFSFKTFQCIQQTTATPVHTVSNRNASVVASAIPPPAIVDDHRNNINSITRHSYFVTLNEMAHGDLKMLCANAKILEDNDLILNLSCQCMIAIAFFHNLGYLHRDAHWGNFLYHKIDDNKSVQLHCYHYKIHGVDYYLPSCGYTIMLYDFGKAEYIPTKRQELLNKGVRQNDIDRYVIEKGVSDCTRIMRAFMNNSTGGWSIFESLPDDTVTRTIESLYHNLKGNARVYTDIHKIIDDIMRQYVSLNVISENLIEGSKIINNVPFVI